MPGTSFASPPLPRLRLLPRIDGELEAGGAVRSARPGLAAVVALALDEQPDAAGANRRRHQVLDPQGPVARDPGAGKVAIGLKLSRSQACRAASPGSRPTRCDRPTAMRPLTGPPGSISTGTGLCAAYTSRTCSASCPQSRLASINHLAPPSGPPASSL